MVPTRVHPGNDPGAAVVDGGVGQGDPAREVLLGLDEVVAVVLVPGEPSGLLGLLVDGLVPVEVGVRPDKVGAEPDEDRMRGERLGGRRPCRQVGRERDRPRLGDGHPLVALPAEEGVDLGLETVDLRGHDVELVGVEHALEHHEPVAVELLGLRGVERGERRLWRPPRERHVPGVRLDAGHVYGSGHVTSAVARRRTVSSR
jgi:hypothetical protein